MSLQRDSRQDTVVNCAETNEFVWNMVRSVLLFLTIVENNIKKAPSRLVRPPRVADSPVSFECRVHSIVRIANEAHGKKTLGLHLVGNSDIVIGWVLGIHIEGEYITGDGLFDVLKASPIARNGYHQYTNISQVWDMTYDVGDEEPGDQK